MKTTKVVIDIKVLDRTNLVLENAILQQQLGVKIIK
jgi:hypothetical protein